MADERQIKSKKRVTAHGEVFTSAREVNAMLDLVKQETERVESRFLEPACGDGNFLAEILRRKLAAVRAQYRRFPPDFEKYSVLALSSIYGVELLPDNVAVCRERLFKIWNRAYSSVCRQEATDRCRQAAQYILAHNILCGDALTMKTSDGAPIIFAQWDLVYGNMFKRRDFRLDGLLQADGPGEGGRPEEGQLSLEDGGFPRAEWEYDEASRSWWPKPIRDDYLLTDYREVQNYG